MSIDREYCVCEHSVDFEIDCECQFQVVEIPPNGWRAFVRQKPMILYDPAEKNVIYVKSLQLFGKIRTSEDDQSNFQ